MKQQELIILVILGAVVLVGATATATYLLFQPAPNPLIYDMNDFDTMPMQGMPCHKMPDGSWMGDCTEEDKQSIQEMMSDTPNNLIASSYEQTLTGLQERIPSSTQRVTDLNRFSLSADIVQGMIDGNKLRLFGYNKQIPGPLLVVDEGDTIFVDFKNNLDVPTTVHWHGLRVDNRFDGVPGVTQDEVLPGETYTYELRFSDPGVYWYHPHVREDYQQEMGLYGNIYVRPKEPDYFSSVDVEEFLILDDMSLENGVLVDFFPDRVTHAVMGRFGNTMLVNGKTSFSQTYPARSIVRLYLSNVANVRPFNISIPGATMKLVGGDLSGYEREAFVSHVVLSPAERYIVDVYFPEKGTYSLLHINPHETYTLGTFTIEPSEIPERTIELGANEYVINDIRSYESYFDKEPDEVYELDILMPGMMGNMGMMMEEEHGIEWEDEMPMMAMMTNNSLQWIIKDVFSGAKNQEISPQYSVGDVVKIRLINNEDSMHPMQHPIHFHGQRFLVLERDGKQEENLVWKDTALVQIGETVDILLEVTNPGEWMVHCHIAEHLQSGMMYSFEVE